jgi:hypothetical protein
MKSIEFLLESSLSRLYTKTQNHSVGAITAYRGDFSKQTNELRNRKLASYLSSRGYGITNITGGYIENPGTENEREVTEQTFFVVNPTEGDDGGKLEKDLIELGQLYDQDSILSYRFGDKPTYIGTTHRKDADPGFGQTYQLTSTEWGDPKGPYFSRVRGRKFAYKEAYEYPEATSINTRHVRYLMAESVAKELVKLREQNDLHPWYHVMKHTR